MIHTRGSLKASIAAAMAVVMLALGLGVPLLDLGRDPTRLVVADVEAPVGSVDHDHRLCAMFAAAPGSPASPAQPPSAAVAPDSGLPTPAAPCTSPADDSSHRSRAPPV